MPRPHHQQRFTKGKAFYALGRLPRGTMNKTEAAYATYLEHLKHTGEILWYKFEGIKLKLADNTFYTCDFAVLPRDLVLQMHECKGWMMEDANVKIKVAASQYPFKFVIVRAKAKKHGGGWSIEHVGREEERSEPDSERLL